jgi:hypothetical protein
MVTAIVSRAAVAVIGIQRGVRTGNRSGTAATRRARASARSARSGCGATRGSDPISSMVRANSSYSLRHAGQEAKWPSSQSRSAAVISSSQ